MKTALAAGNDHEAGARRALMQRLADDLNVLASADRMDWTCCWLTYEGPYGELWRWQTCGGKMPGGLPFDPDGLRVHCDHRHHQFETFLALG